MIKGGGIMLAISKSVIDAILDTVLETGSVELDGEIGRNSLEKLKNLYDGEKSKLVDIIIVEDEEGNVWTDRDGNLPSWEKIKNRITGWEFSIEQEDIDDVFEDKIITTLRIWIDEKESIIGGGTNES